MDTPRDDLFRARSVGPDLTDPQSSDSIGLLSGHFTPFEQWTEIDSVYEGRFMERIVPGALSKTITESVRNMRVLYDHGKDPSIGNKVLGPIDDLREDEYGAFYAVPLYDTSYNRDLLPGLRDKAYGASYRFRVVRDEWVDRPARSEHNPDGIPERTLREVAVYEFGPVTFPAYAGASSGVRSLTDHFRFGHTLGTPLPDAAPRGTSAIGAAESSDDAAARHLGMSPEQRARALALLPL